MYIGNDHLCTCVAGEAHTDHLKLHVARKRTKTVIHVGPKQRLKAKKIQKLI